MLKPFQYRLLTALALVCVILVCLNGALFYMNRASKIKLNERAQYIQQSQSIRALYQDIVRSLANLSVEKKDDQIKSLLAQEGFTINPAPQNSNQQVKP